MSAVTVKDEVVEAIRAMPADVSIDDIIDRLYMLAHIERGLADIDAGRTHTTAQVREAMRQWPV